jgi:hypothetical protein
VFGTGFERLGGAVSDADPDILVLKQAKEEYAMLD